VAIATLTRKEQKALLKHGHFEYIEIAVYASSENRRPESVTVECTKCGTVLVELVGGRDQCEDGYVCCLCHRRKPAPEVRLHQGQHVCNDCWDERLRTTE
jgi:hypothetical protein